MRHLRIRRSGSPLSASITSKPHFFSKSTFSASNVRQLLSADIDWSAIVRTWPKHATAAPDALLFSEQDREIYQQGGTWSELFDATGIGQRFPLLVWSLAIAMIGLLTWPLTFIACPGLRDRGYNIARALGLLFVSWGAWLLASSRWLTFSRGAIAVPLYALLFLAIAAAWYSRRQLVHYVRTHWRLLLLSESIFWLLFLSMVWIRWRNPDLWHPNLGGEKPMDFAYLNAVVRSIYFPPYDPWFAGGYINYYYFGFVLVATLVKLTGIVPAIAYNLAVPTFMAMTATGAFSVVLSLHPLREWRLRPTMSSSGEDAETTSEPEPSERKRIPGLGRPVVAALLE